MKKIGRVILALCLPVVASAQPADPGAPPDAGTPPPMAEPPPPDSTPPPPTTPIATTPPTPEAEETPTADESRRYNPDQSPVDDRGKKKKKKKDLIQLKHHWVRFDLPHHTELRMRLYLEPMFRYSHVVPPSGVTAPDDTVDWFIRRARLGFDVRGEHGIGFRFEQSVKNNHSEIHNMFGYWKPNHDLELQIGFIKPPGGLERDTFSFDQEFIERSVVTYFNRDHEVGLKLMGTSSDQSYFWAAAVTRDPPPLPGGDPEDSPVVPTGVEEEDVFRAGSKWAAQGRIGVMPSDAFEASINAGVRFRPDEPDFGEIAVEPYDTTFLTNQPYKGTMFRVGADVGISQPHWKLTSEVAFRRNGEALAYPDGTVASQMSLGEHLTAEAAYLVFGWTPNGRFGHAIDAAPLREGWALVARAMAARINPAAAPVATMGSIEVGWRWEASRNLRMQVDMAVEKFNENAITVLNENRDATRIYAQSWFIFRL